MSKMTAEEARLDRLVSAYLHAQVDAKAAVEVLTKPLPHSRANIATVKRATESMNWYLTELEKR